MFDLKPFGFNDRLLDDVSTMDKKFFDYTSNIGFRADILDLDHSYVVEAELPGFKKENIDVTMDGDYLIVRATTSSEKEDPSNYIKKERAYGSYERSFYIPNINASEIEAQYNNGLLKVSMPKTEKAKSKKQITIK